MRIVAGSRPPQGEVLGEYGWSRLTAVINWVGAVAFMVVYVNRSVRGPGWRGPGWEVAAWALELLGIWTAWATTFTPRLRVTRESFKLIARPTVRWADVVEVLPPRAMRSFVRVRLSGALAGGRTVLELWGVGPDRLEAVAQLAPQAQPAG